MRLNGSAPAIEIQRRQQGVVFVIARIFRNAVQRKRIVGRRDFGNDTLEVLAKHVTADSPEIGSSGCLDDAA